MQTDGSVSRLIHGVQLGSGAAASRLWDRLSPRLLEFARGQLNGRHAAVADEEDAAVTAFHSFLRRAADNRFPDLANREQLWRLLATITARKILNQLRNETCAKRDADARTAFGSRTIACLPSAIPGPAFQASMEDTFQHLLGMLADDELREIVVLRVRGFSNQEIADQLNRALSTIERRLRVIRITWQSEYPE